MKGNSVENMSRSLKYMKKKSKEREEIVEIRSFVALRVATIILQNLIQIFDLNTSLLRMYCIRVHDTHALSYEFEIQTK